MSLSDFRRLAGLTDVRRLSEAEANSGADRSTHPNVVEYGVREMMKGKSPAAAAKSTAKKLGGAANMFLGSPTEPVVIEPDVLEMALWDRLSDFTVQAISKIKPGMEHYALDGTLQHFRQAPKIRPVLKAHVQKRLGRNPFAGEIP